MKKNNSSKFYMGAIFSGILLLALFGITSAQIIAPVANKPSANLDQCRNGPASMPVPCTNGAYVNGNLNEQQSHYYEGDSAPYRIRFDNLTIGATYTIEIQYDVTKSGKYAIDYLTSYNRTESVNNNPCDGVAGCNPASFTTFPIPADPNFTGLSGTQIPGVFTFYGATITMVSSYMPTGDINGDSSTGLTITFVPSVTNPVLAYGGHIATTADYPERGSASDLQGSPYHMRLIAFTGDGVSGNLGNQDRSLKVTPLAPTAAGADISGRVLSSRGRGISRATVTVLDTNTLESRTVRTNPFGYFSMQEMPVGDFYIISVNSKGYWFANNNQGLTLTENLTNLQIIGTPFYFGDVNGQISDVIPK